MPTQHEGPIAQPSLDYGAEGKMVRKFDWSVVDEDLTRRLVEAFYLHNDRLGDVELLYSFEAGPLARQAERTLGSPMKSSHMKILFPILKQYWVPKLKSETLDHLVLRLSTAMTPEARSRLLRTQKQKRSYLQEKNSATSARANFHTVFVQAHKRASPVRKHRGPGPVEDAHGVVHLAGHGTPNPHTPYDHKTRAWAWLDGLSEGTDVQSRSALLVLPTGAGKTSTAVEWALRQMEADPTTRVLWLAHQQELLEQAGRTFEAAASERGQGFSRRLRLLRGDGPGLVTLSESDLDVVIVSRQLITSSGRRGQRLLAQYLSRPTIVVVDEAHHAASPTYDTILDTVTSAPHSTLLGLTATPWPSASGARKRLKERFPHSFVQKTEPLMESGVLATPIFHTVATHQRVVLTADQTKVAGASDFQPEVLRKLATRERDAVIVSTWCKQPEQWGKTLVFATSIEHADNLTAAFKVAGVGADCIHSEVEDPSGVLACFRTDSAAQVLVSVGMLTEGVDVPAARTAFLARPTTSVILMRQMIGRVLRGVHAGGDAHAHVVYLRDQWGDFLDAIDPREVVDGESSEAGEAVLPPVYDDTEELVHLDLIAQLTRDALRTEATLPTSMAVTAAELVGYYELGDTNALVLAHQKDAFVKVIDHALAKRGFQGSGPLSFFEDLPAPAPGGRSLIALVAWIREYEMEPNFHPLQATLDPRRFAAELRAAPAMTVDARSSWLRERYERSAIGALFADLDQFEEAVEDALRNLLRADAGRRPHENPEGSIPLSEGTGLQPLPGGRRDLRAPLQRVAERARDLLVDELPRDVELEARLDVRELEIRFSKRPLRDAWAYWNLRRRGTNAGQPMIVVNQLLETTPEAVPDEVLEYLIYHELLHHLLPGQGHDSQFRRLEELWPDIDRAELALMTLHERWVGHQLEGSAPGPNSNGTEAIRATNRFDPRWERHIAPPTSEGRQPRLREVHAGGRVGRPHLLRAHGQRRHVGGRHLQGRGRPRRLV